MTEMTKYLDPKLITFFEAKDQTEALRTLVDLLDSAGKLPNKEKFLEAIIDREKVVSTGIGMGVAFPHAKQPEFKDFFVAIAILKEGVDWKALDDTPVRIIFMIGGPDNKQTEYLQLLSKLTMAIEDEKKRKQLLKIHSPESIIALFQE